MSDFLAEKNLHELYYELSKSGLVDYKKSLPFTMVDSPNSAWPKIIYLDGAIAEITNEEIEFLSKEILLGRAPNTIILNETLLNSTQLERFSKSNGKPIGRWDDMFLEKNNSFSPSVNKELQIKLVENDKELHDWVKIIENVLFSDQKIDTEIFDYGVKRGFLKLYLGYYQKQPVATTMLFSGSDAGVYMVATLPGFRKKGFAKSIMSIVQQDAFNSGFNQVVLQSTREGLPLYNSLGYKSNGKMIFLYFS